MLLIHLMLCESFLPDEIPFLDYFEDTYLGHMLGVREAPLFPIEMWNVHERFGEGWMRSKNACEAFHRSFGSHMVRGQHPVFWKFLDPLKKKTTGSRQTRDCTMHQGRYEACSA